MNYIDNFNTSLSAPQESQFQAWIAAQGSLLKRDLSRDLSDYDLRGYWLSNPGSASGGHLPDTYKKPNHPTFSEESIYHGTPDLWGGKWEGGKWIGNDKDGWSFQVSKSMLAKTHSKDMLRNYFADYEPGVAIGFPPENVYSK